MPEPPRKTPTPTSDLQEEPGSDDVTVPRIVPDPDPDDPPPGLYDDDDDPTAPGIPPPSMPPEDA